MMSNKKIKEMVIADMRGIYPYAEIKNITIKSFSLWGGKVIMFDLIASFMLSDDRENLLEKGYNPFSIWSVEKHKLKICIQKVIRDGE